MQNKIEQVNTAPFAAEDKQAIMEEPKEMTLRQDRHVDVLGWQLKPCPGPWAALAPPIDSIHLSVMQAGRRGPVARPPCKFC